MSIFKRKFAPNRWKKAAGIASDSLRIRVVDSDGNTVSGAIAGDHLSGSYEPGQMVKGKTIESHLNGKGIVLPSGRTAVLRFICEEPVLVSGQDGIIEIPSSVVNRSTSTWRKGQPSVVYVIDPARMIGGLACYRSSDYGKMTDVVLKPLCHVRGTVSRDDGDSLIGVGSSVYWGTVEAGTHILKHGGTEGALEMLLPPGEYRLHSMQLMWDDDENLRSLDCWKTIEVPDDVPSLEVDMHLVLSDGIVEVATGKMGPLDGCDSNKEDTTQNHSPADVGQ